jgi:hypothetical protein
MRTKERAELLEQERGLTVVAAFHPTGLKVDPMDLALILALESEAP